MTKKLYVGNLPHSLNDTDLSNLFVEFGEIESAQIIMDRRTNRSKGFGFIEMTSEEDAQKAIESLNGTDLDGRALTVNVARPPEKRSFNDNRNNRKF